MTDTNASRIVCEGCGRSFRWKPEFADRPLKCVCGTAICAKKIPLPQDEYDLADQPPIPVQPVTRSASAIAAHRDGVVPPTKQVVDYISPGAQGQTKIDLLFPDRIKDLYMPLALVGGGATVEMLVWAYVLNPFAQFGANKATMLQYLAVNVALETMVLLGVFLFAAWIRGIKIKPFFVTGLKISAVILGGNGIAFLLAPLLIFIPFLGIFALWALFFAAYYTLLAALFDLDESDATFCVSCLFITHLVLTYTLPRFW